MMYINIVMILTLLTQGLSSGIPIWELLTHQEKVGNLTFLFLDLVNLYCKKSDIPDCEKVLTLYGVSNLLKEDEYTLDLLDPYHWDSRDALWRVAMNGVLEFPRQKTPTPTSTTLSGFGTETESDINTITNSEMDYGFPNYYDYDVEVGERHPYAVKVPPPPNFKPDQSQTDQESTGSHSKVNPLATHSKHGTDNHVHPSSPVEHSQTFNRSDKTEPNFIVLMTTRDSPSKESKNRVSSNPKLVRKESTSATKPQEGVVQEPILFALLRK